MRSLSVASSGARERPPSEVYARVKLLTKFVEMADALSSSEIASLDRPVDRGGEGSAEATVLHAEQNEIEESGLSESKTKLSESKSYSCCCSETTPKRPKQLFHNFSIIFIPSRRLSS